VEFSSRHFADVAVAAPSGRIDHPAAETLEHALAHVLADSGIPKAGIVLDFSGVDYISSVGLRVLMIAAKQMRVQETPIAVASLRPIVAEIFAISRFDRVLGVFPTVRGAIERFSASALEAFDAARAPTGQ